MSLCLVFPKPFEVAAFMIEIQSNIRYFERLGNNNWLLHFTIGDITYSFKILVVDESDFMFYLKLEDLLQNDQYLLVGSCGCLIPEDDNNYDALIKRAEEKTSKLDKLENIKIKMSPSDWLYKPLLVTTVIKYDRGELESSTHVELQMSEHKFKVSNNNIRILKEKRKSVGGSIQVEPTNVIEHFKTRIKKHERLKIQETDIMRYLTQAFKIHNCEMRSNNFLMNSIAQSDSTDPMFYDMETYDFVKFCHTKKLTLIGVIRIISDIIGKSQSTTRAFFKYSKSKDVLISIIQIAAKQEVNNLVGDTRALMRMQWWIVTTKIIDVINSLADNINVGDDEFDSELKTIIKSYKDLVNTYSKDGELKTSLLDHFDDQMKNNVKLLTRQNRKRLKR